MCIGVDGTWKGIPLPSSTASPKCSRPARLVRVSESYAPYDPWFSSRSKDAPRLRFRGWLSVLSGSVALAAARNDGGCSPFDTPSYPRPRLPLVLGPL